MKIKNKRSVFYLFTAMVISSLVIGSFCQTKFVPVPSLINTAMADTTKSLVNTVASQYPPVDVDMKLEKLGDHTWYVKGKAGIATDNAGFISNAGVIVTDEGVVIVDALGSPSLAYKLIQKIKKITDKPIVKVVVTHFHADHIYGLQVFKELGAEIISADGVYDYIDSDAATSRLEERRFSLDPWVNDKTVVVIPDRIIDKSENFTLGGVNFILSFLGKAHSDGDLTLYVEDDRILFSGDIIFEGRVPFLGSSDSKHWLAALEEMELQGTQAVVPGHGPFAKDPKSIALTRKYLAFIRNKMGVAVEDMIDFDEAYNEIDWSDYEKLPAFEATNRRNAFQVYLSMEAEGS